MINRDKMVFFNTAYMEKYQGNWHLDKPINGGSFISENGWGGEVFNFKPYKGTMYGYVEPGVVKQNGPQRNIDISRLTRPRAITTVAHISGVLIIWVARSPKQKNSVMVGWYENATLYRASQRLLEDEERILPNGSYDYFATAKESDCQLIPVGNRTLTIPREAGGFGHSHIWHANSQLGEQIKSKIIDLISNMEKATSYMKFAITLEQDEDGFFVVSCPALPGCHSQGRSREEAIANIKEAIRGYIASMRKHGEPIPSITEVEVAV